MCLFAVSERRMCRVRDCRMKHLHHYCKMCRKVDVDHFAANCPNFIDYFNRSVLRGDFHVEGHFEGHPGRIITLFHETSMENAIAIYSEKKFKPSVSGMFGAACYFATTAQDTRYKANHHGVYIVCLVRVGISLVQKSGNPSLTKEEVEKFGCNRYVLSPPKT